MIHTPRLILYLAITNYLSDEQITNLKLELGKSNLKQDRRFIAILNKHFDFNLFKDKPYIWQDIWLFNYLTYEVKTKLPRKGLIAKYEREISIPFTKITNDIYQILDINDSRG